MKTYTQEETKWNYWLAGITDGNGCFYINRSAQNVSFEVTMPTESARVLYDIKNKLKGGTVRARSGSDSVRYRVKAKAMIIEILNRLNGKIYHPTRSQLFKEACELFGLEPILPDCKTTVARTPDGKLITPYIAGLIDTDGTYAISVSNASQEDSQISGVEGKIIRLKKSRGHNQLSAKVTTSNKDYGDFLLRTMDFGQVYAEQSNPRNKSPNPKYHWTIATQEEFTRLYELLKQFPLRSLKMHRMRLSLLYFKYKELGYHLANSNASLGYRLYKPDPLKEKMWEKLARSWYKYSK